MSEPAATKSFTLPGGRAGGRDVTEQRILDATHDLLQSGESLAGLSVGRIVQAAGVSRATFYLHFPDKRALVAKLAEQRVSEFGAIAGPFLSGDITGRDGLTATITEIVQTWHTQAGMLASLVELAEYDDGASEAWQATIGEIARQAAAGIANFRPKLPPARRAALAEVVTWMVERSCHQMAGTGASKRDLTRTAEALSDAIWPIITAEV